MIEGLEEKLGYLSATAKATEERLGRVQVMLENHMEEEKQYRELHSVKMAAIEVIEQRQVRMEEVLDKIDHRDTTSKAVIHTLKVLGAVLAAILTFHFGDIKPLLAGLKAIWIG